METIELTDEQISGVIDKVLEGAKQRYENHARVSEADYFAGVLVVLTFLQEGPGFEELWEHTPPMWILGIMSGRSPTAIYIADGNEEIQRKIDQKMGHAFRLRENAENLLNIVKTLTHDPDSYAHYEAVSVVCDIESDFLP